ncbi:GATA transcription factor 19 [Prunus avium]|uniref:GATA transcription factor 19 n=1 Tax=Prunus avium TaxID=42229 RepID=A0A6P5U2H0_PRUAV|nr:GATA transcription factor 19 [Prunus avium]
MQRCSSSSHGNMAGPCTCGVLHHTQSNSSFSMLFSMPNHHKPYDHHHHHLHETQHDHHNHMYPFASSSSSVDCTLSLGTPSTRLTENDVVLDDKRTRNERRSVSNFCWDLLQPKHHATSATSSHHHKNGSHRSGGNGNVVSNAVHSNNDPLLARRCANCDTTSTPLWRNGPRGPKSLCNACGIRFKKEERRATAAAANGASSSVVGMEHNSHMLSQHHHNNSWMPHSQTQKMPCFSPAMGNEFRFMEDDTAHHENDATGIPFLSWRLNVTDRPSLVHDFTR